MSDPRRAAAAALIKQEQGGYANLVLAHALERFEGDGRDRAFLSAIFYGTVERMATIDYLLNLFLSRPLPQMDRTVRAVLRSGVCLYMPLSAKAWPCAGVWERPARPAW